MDYFTPVILCISHNSSTDDHCWPHFICEEKKNNLVVQGHPQAWIHSQIYGIPKSLFFSTILHITLSCIFLPLQQL